MTELEEKMYKNGMLKISHTLVRGITPINTIVLSRLLIERDYAVRNKYITDDGFFIADENEVAENTGIDSDIVRNITQNLYRRGIIDGKKIDDYYLIRINDEEIIEFIDNLETVFSRDYKNWDEGLAKVQKDIRKLNIVSKDNKKENKDVTTTDKNNKIDELKNTTSIKRTDSNDTPVIPKYMH